MQKQKSCCKNDANVIMFRDKEKGIGLKCKEKCGKDDHINKCVELSMRKGDLNTLLSKHSN